DGRGVDAGRAQIEGVYDEKRHTEVDCLACSPDRSVQRVIGGVDADDDALRRRRCLNHDSSKAITSPRGAPRINALPLTHPPARPGRRAEAFGPGRAGLVPGRPALPTRSPRREAEAGKGCFTRRL